MAGAAARAAASSLQPQDLAPRIEWQAEWRKTFEANGERWAKELARSVEDADERSVRVFVRLAVLIEAVARRAPESKALDTRYGEVVARLRRAGGHEQARELLERLPTVLPKRLDLALAGYHQALASSKWPEHGRSWPTAAQRRLAEHAARRLVALSRAGRLPGDHEDVVASWKNLSLLARLEGRLLEAAAMLDTAAALTRLDAWCRYERAALALAAGRYDEAVEGFRTLVEQTNDYNAKNRLSRLRTTPLSRPPSFPSRFGLRAAWERLRDRALDESAADLARLIADAAAGDSLVPWDDGRRASVWTAIDRALSARPQDELALLRRQMAAPARAALRAARRSGRADELLAVFRRHPWADAAHQALLEHGEHALEAGHSGLALRSFRDALARAVDGAVRAKAQVGLWLALAQEPSRRAALEASLAGVDPAARYPWHGQQRPAAFILEQLVGAKGEAKAAVPTLATLGRRVLRGPSVHCWPPELLDDLPRQLLGHVAAPETALVPADGHVAISAPRLLAAFDDAGRMRWSRTPPLFESRIGRIGQGGRRLLTVPGTCRAAVADGRVYARWGLDLTGHYLTSVAAFDLATGAMRWSASADEAWRKLWPASDPAAAEGRVYVLAVQRGPARALPVAPLFLLCLDAADGSVLWQRLLAQQDYYLSPGEAFALSRDDGVDLVHYGNAVTVRDGAVFCLTNAGFVARCDARDGLVEWTHTYPRAHLATCLGRALSRRGESPVVAGHRVVCVPRDCIGAFALDARTGRKLWESPFAPSDRAIGSAGGVVLLRDRHEVVALELASGAARWTRRFDEGIAGSTRLVGPALTVGTPDGLHLLAADTGKTLETVPWGADGPMETVVRGNSLVGLALEPPGGKARNLGRPLNPRAPKASAALRLPLARTWDHVRPNARLLLPPPEAKTPGRLYVLSRRLLDCVAATPRGALLWRRPIAAGLQQTAWAEKLLLLVYRRRVVALDTATGQPRWDTETRISIRQAEVVPPVLAFGSFGYRHRTKASGAIALASGKLLWQHNFPTLGADSYHNRFVRIAHDGQRLHFLAELERQKPRGYFDVAVGPADGRVVAVRSWIPNLQEDLVALAADRRYVFHVTRSAGLYRLRLGDKGAAVRWPLKLGPLDWAGITFFQIAGRWLQIARPDRSSPTRHVHWIARTDDPNYQLRRFHRGRIVGDRLYEIHGRTLDVVDLRTKKELPGYRVPATVDGRASIVAFHEQGDTLFVVSTVGSIHEDLHRGPLPLRIDAFDRRTAAHQATQVLDGGVYWEVSRREHGAGDPVRRTTQLRVQDGVLFAADLCGLHAFAPAPAGRVPPREPPHVVHRVRRPAAVDGAAGEWGPRGAIPLAGGAKLFLAHDATDLSLALSHPSRGSSPRRGRGHVGGGDWLEVGLTSHLGSFRWGLALDGRGRAVWDDLGPDRMPEGLRGAVGHTLANGRAVYELAVPLKGVLRWEELERRQPFGLSLCVWEERPGRGPVRRVTWGGALEARQMLAHAHRQVALHPLTHEALDAGEALVAQLPDLTGSAAFLRDHILPLRGATRDGLLALFRRVAGRSPRSRLVELLLPALDQRLRTGYRADPSAEILELAEAAGVPRAVRRRYARLAKAQLSQWVYLDPKKPPSTVFIQLGGPDGSWEHRAFWGADSSRIEGTLNTPSRRYAGPLPPAGSWQQLRVPLMWLDMQRRSIDSISFGQVGGGRVVWDRTAVVLDGKEHVFLDDESPAASTARGWQWVSRPVRSGRRAHTHSPPSRSSYHTYHYTRGLKQPIVAHLVPPATGGVVSTWVYVDPARRPEYVLFGARDLGGVGHTCVWGTTRSGAHFMGPLPKPGVWTELRIPLAHTPLHATPLDGLSFTQYRGRAVWDRAVLTVDGKTQAIVDDEPPPKGTIDSSWLWVDKPVRSGKKAHTYRNQASSGTHAVGFHLAPITGHMAFDRDRAAAVLREQIPRLGPTAEAWRFFGELLRLRYPSYEWLLDHHTWFLKALPDHPNALDVLSRLVDCRRGLKDETPVLTVYALAKAAGVPEATLYKFRRAFRAARGAFVHTWQAVGPFPNRDSKGYDTAYPPETEGIHLDRQYDGARRRTRWRSIKSATDFIDLGACFRPNENVVAYAVCWVYTPRARDAVVELGTDDGFKFWLNRKLVRAKLIPRPAAPGQEIMPVGLRRGWNELLVKVENGTQVWGFYLELLGPDGNSLLPEVKLATTPPPR